MSDRKTASQPRTPPRGIQPTTSSQVELGSSPVRVNHGSLQDIRIALDDTLVKYLNEVRGLSQGHGQTDRYLVVQFILNLIGALTAAYAYVTPFTESRLIVGVASAL